MNNLNFNYELLTTSLVGTKKEKIIQNFLNVLEEIKKDIDVGEVLSTKISDYKYITNHFVENVYDENINEKYFYAGKYSSHPEELQYLSLPREVRSINAFKKKLDKISSPSKNLEVFKEMEKITLELLNLYHVMEHVKEITVSASEKKKKEMDSKKEDADIYLKKLVSHADNQKVISLLNSKATDIENGLYIEELKYLESVVKEYQEKIKTGETDPNKIFEKDIQERMILNRLVKRIDDGDYRTKNKVFKLVKNYQSLLEKDARQYAQDIVGVFVTKNSHKLAYIISTKNNMENVELSNLSLSRGYIECDLDVSFKDKSKFIANTSVVLAYSKYGKPFYRYPTIFKNVVLPDGSNMKDVSEQRMDEFFALQKEVKEIKTIKKSF